MSRDLKFRGGPIPFRRLQNGDRAASPAGPASTGRPCSDYFFQ